MCKRLVLCCVPIIRYVHFVGNPWRDRRLWLHVVLIALSIAALVRQIRGVNRPPEFTGERHEEEP